MEKWEKWLTILTNLGVIAGLVLLTIEISQNSDALRFSAARVLAKPIAARIGKNVVELVRADVYRGVSKSD